MSRTTRSGNLLVRPLEAGDTETVQRVFAGLSLTSAYLRFDTGLTLLSPRMATGLAAVEPGRHRVFAAELAGRPVGLGRWARHGGGPDDAELALEVGDAWQGRGVGRALLAAVAVDARSAEIETLVAYVAPTNTRMVGWLRRLGAHPPRDLDDAHRLPVDQLLERLLAGGDADLAVVA
jgi:ribosomal protein S18 acetylase RimI-like enzyme